MDLGVLEVTRSVASCSLCTRREAIRLLITWRDRRVVVVAGACMGKERLLESSMVAGNIDQRCEGDRWPAKD